MSDDDLHGQIARLESDYRTTCRKLGSFVPVTPSATPRVGATGFVARRAGKSLSEASNRIARWRPHKHITPMFHAGETPGWISHFSVALFRLGSALKAYLTQVLKSGSSAEKTRNI